jgi:hypothetical protein
LILVGNFTYPINYQAFFNLSILAPLQIYNDTEL